MRSLYYRLTAFVRKADYWVVDRCPCTEITYNILNSSLGDQSHHSWPPELPSLHKDIYMEVIAYLAAAFIGISLGLIGGGGSILTLPVLVYLFHVPLVTATAYSLFIAGSTSLAGAYPKYKQGLINVRMAILFGIPSIVAVFVANELTH